MSSSSIHLVSDTEQANQTIADAYDQVIYESYAFPYTSPGHLRAAAHLYGVSTIPLAQARVLELGCAGGGNLLPFALAYPQAKVVGVDLSAVQIEQGQELIRELGLTNMQLHAMSLADIDASFGEFDYIIVHGVFSWVPPEVRSAIFRVVHESLSPEGVAVVSFNTYPGWKASDILRDAMILHSEVKQDETDKVASARAMLDLMSEGLAVTNPLGSALLSAVHKLRQQTDFYVAHEYLESFNAPCYLLEFADLAQQHGVSHVGDVEANSELPISFGTHVRQYHEQATQGLPRALRHQYLDFAIGRTFRKSLVVSQERGEQAFPEPDASAVVDLRWAGYFLRAEPEDGKPSDLIHFKNFRNQTIVTKDPATVGIIEVLSEAWPVSLDIKTLLERVRTKLAMPEGDEADRATLGALQTLFRSGKLRYALERSPYDSYDHRRARQYPTLIPAAKQLLEKRKEPGFGIGVCNLWHDTVQLSLTETDWFLLDLMDGTESQAKLRTRLRDALSQGLVQNIDGTSLKGQRNLDSTADKMLQAVLDLLQRNALLQ